MDLELYGKVVLVTGSGQGIGRAIGLAFANEGAHVAFHYNTSAASAEKAVAEAREFGVASTAIQADISRQTDIERLVKQTTAELGPIDVLVNNAAFTQGGAFLDMTADDWAPQVDVTVLGMMRVTQTVLRGMVARESGAIVTLMGDSGRVGESRLVPVATARAAATGFTKSIAKEFARHGIRANCVSLGLVRSEAFDHHTGNADDERMQRILAHYPLRRLGVPDDIPPMVLLLASPKAGWITGQVVSVNGGYAMV
jgi:NAD(P)-dependent dehydrogenase (short-subunit alcohol dehydrogenase family)